MQTVILERGNPFVEMMLDGLTVRFDAMKALLAGDVGPYIRWHMEAIGSTLEQATAMAGKYLGWVRSIQKGYSDEVGRALAEEAGDSWHPVRVACQDDGSLLLQDGNHRTLTMLALGRPIEAQVVFMGNAIDRLIRSASGDRPYQPTHPAIPGKTIRKRLERYRMVAEALDDVGVESVLELGCAEGAGLWTIKRTKPAMKVAGTEAQPWRAAAAEKLGDLAGFQVHKTDAIPKRTPHAYIALSVLHHMMQSPQDVETMAARLSKAKALVVELPEAASATWHPGMERIGTAGILAELEKHWPRKRIIYTDAGYAGRETILFWR